MMDVLPSPPESRYPTFYMLTHSVSAVMILLLGHVLQVTLWAALYFYDWAAFKSFGTAMYFSLASFTTLGAAELSLPPQHRMIGAFEIGRRHDDVRLVDRPSGRRRRPHRSPRPALERLAHVGHDADREHFFAVDAGSRACGRARCSRRNAGWCRA